MTNQHLTATCHSEIASRLSGLDHLARQLELRWGVGRLRLLIDDALRSRFDQQIALMNKVLNDDSSRLEDIVAQIDGAKRGWTAIENAAAASGHQPTPAVIWEAPNPDGGVFLIVRDNADASQVAIQAKERGCSVYTLDEIGRLLARYPEIAKIKDSFPGAVVTSVRPRTPTAEFLNDDLVF